MKELSIFVDESGDYGVYDYRSPYYIVTLIFHEQNANISEHVSTLDDAISLLDLPNETIHMGPLIRREKEYRNYSRELRIKGFAFAQKAPFTYKTFVIEKKHVRNRLEWNMKLTKAIGEFIKKHIGYFTDFHDIIIYYDNGQTELTGVIVTIFNTLLNHVAFRSALPAKYKLLQAADLICTLELLSLKSRAKTLSASELSFFESRRTIEKNYLKAIRKKEFF
jgi:hypothetical protein